jgi:hypothetical protein
VLIGVYFQDILPDIAVAQHVFIGMLFRFGAVERGNQEMFLFRPDIGLGIVEKNQSQKKTEPQDINDDIRRRVGFPYRSYHQNNGKKEQIIQRPGGPVSPECNGFPLHDGVL